MTFHSGKLRDGLNIGYGVKPYLRSALSCCGGFFPVAVLTLRFNQSNRTWIADMPSSSKEPASTSEPQVAQIRIEYEDGRFDDIKLVPNPGLPLYGLDRVQPSKPERSLGAHSAGAIAALLFRITTHRTEDS